VLTERKDRATAAQEGSIPFTRSIAAADGGICRPRFPLKTMTCDDRHIPGMG